MNAHNSRAVRGAVSLAIACVLASCNGNPSPAPPPKLEAPKFVEQLN